jgi:DNA-binding CsgD family transcriptional regulator
VGRERERSTLDGCLRDAAERTVVVAISGEAGIGKSTLLAATEATAASKGFRVLSCRPVPAESVLSFAALGDLLVGVTDEDLHALPTPQREALEVALLRVAPAVPIDPRSIGTGLLSLLRCMAAAQPIAVVVDDSAWIDRPTAAALVFALRRLDSEPVAALIACRSEDGAPLDALDADLGSARRLVEVDLGPLSFSAIYHAILERTGLEFPRPILQRIFEASGGNPLFAIELARALAEHGGRPGPGQPLPVPDRLLTLIEDRIAQLPAAWIPTLASIALLPDPRVDVLCAAVGPVAGEAVAGSTDRGILDVDPEDGRVRFRHPLLGEVALASTSTQQRRELHGRLAPHVADTGQRARHLALAAEGPDAVVAASLDDAATEATARGAPHVAAQHLALAIQLTPGGDRPALATRHLAQAEAALRSGDTGDARAGVQQVLALAPSGATRARALELDARILHVTGTSAEAAACCDEALSNTDGDAALTAQVHATRALVEYDDLQAAQYHARAALDLLSTLRDPDPAVHVQAILAIAQVEVDLGRPIPMDLVEVGLSVERRAPAARVSDRLGAALGAWLKTHGRLDEARLWLERTLAAAIEEGDESSMPYALSHLPQLELWSGRWADAESRALEHLEVAQRTAQAGERRQAVYNLALVRAHLGQLDEAEQLVVDGLAQWSDAWSVMTLSTVHGFIELSRGRYAEAVMHLDRSAVISDQIGVVTRMRWRVDHAEALVGHGDLDRALHEARSLQAFATDVDHRVLAAGGLRVEARAAAARQDLDDARRLLDAAQAHYRDGDDPFERARTHLALGQVLRRRGERGAAREQLAAAEAAFGALPAPVWAARAAEEAARLPTSRAKRTEQTGLTTSESRIAELVAQGHTNQEVAQELFVSPKTVEATLTRIYMKLGIRSRTQLAAAWVRQPEEDTTV